MLDIWENLRSWSRQFTWEQAQDARRRTANGEAQVSIARSMGTTPQVIWAIVHHRIYRAVTEPTGRRPDIPALDIAACTAAHDAALARWQQMQTSIVRPFDQEQYDRAVAQWRAEQQGARA